MIRMLTVVFLLIVSAQGLAQTELPAALDERYNALIQELRCLVCQNQNIAESNAPLAVDLKQQVAEMMQEGRSDNDIKEYLLARYGDFVLYRPTFKPMTWFLWLGPFVLLAIGLFTASRLFSGSRPETEEAVDKTAIDALLQHSGTDPDNNNSEKP